MLLGGNLVVIASEQDLLSEKTSINQAGVVRVCHGRRTGVCVCACACCVNTMGG